MIDKNLDIRQEYYALLNGKISPAGYTIPFYYGFVPLSAMNYVLMSVNSNIGIETKCDQLRQIDVTLVVHTRSSLNSGILCDNIASLVLNNLYPNREFKIDGLMSTKLISDNMITDYDSVSKMQVIERIITFRHIY